MPAHMPGPCRARSRVASAPPPPLTLPRPPETKWESPTGERAGQCRSALASGSARHFRCLPHAGSKMADGGEGEALVRRRRRRGSGRGAGLESRAAVPGSSMEKKEKPLPRVNIHSAFWILASIALTYYVEFFKTVKEIIQKESGWFVLGSCLLVVSLSVAFFCIIYLEWYHGIADYETSYPTLIPITTASFIAAAVCFNISLWPVWSFLTPLVLFIQFMGIVMLVSLLG